MLAFTERRGRFDYPITAKDVKIGSNRRRGRPRLTTAALQYQYNEEQVYSDTDLEEKRLFNENKLRVTVKASMTF